MDKFMKNKPALHLSRRNFIKTVAVAAASGSALSFNGSNAVQAATETRGKVLNMAGYKLDRTEALVDGRIKIDGYDIEFSEAGIGDLNTHVFSGPQTLDVTEIGLHPFMLAYANDNFRDYLLLPIFPIRLFRHKSIFIRTDRNIEKPQDLKGKKIATAGYSSTSLTWIRGLLRDEYGLNPEDMQWVISRKDSSAAAAGTVSKQESMLPEGVPVQPGPEGLDESELLESGEVDACFHAAEPRAFTERRPNIARLFADYRQVEQAYFAKTGIFPIMHAVAMKKELAQQHPGIITAVFKAYSQAKQVAYDYLAGLAFIKDILPWIAQEFEDTRELMGPNYFSYGIEPNRRTLEALFRYSHEQGLCSRQLKIEEIFAPQSLELSE
jgi:4,5-dihydroxyphthalate decarboxylase